MREIPDYSRYEINEDGDIFVSKTMKKMSTHKNKFGYVRTHLINNSGDRVQVAVHRVVYSTFVGPIDKDKEINHLDGIKTNNNVSNLEQTTRKQNIKHAYDTGLKCNYGLMNKRAKLTPKDVIEIRDLRSWGMSFCDIGFFYNVTDDYIKKIIYRKKWGWVVG